MAVDLHDGPVQKLVNLVLRLEMAEKSLPEGAEGARAEYTALRQFARDILGDLRRFMFELRPASLEEFSLLPVLRQYLQDFRKEYSIEVDLQLQDADWRLGREAELSLFRVIQEALTNVRKHARASRVVIRLGRQDGFVTAEIIDDGRGFDVMAARARATAEKRLGLTSMEDRVHALGGTLAVESSTGGTTVRAFIPVADENMAVTDGTGPRVDRR
ncbi:MAG: sensor histidine kinase [Armatimonadota bacterium]|nr:sensor histidine kinase [Armatimonadota bacterium]